QYQADRAGREVIQLPPDHRPDVQAVIGPVQVESLSAVAVVEHDVEAAGHGDQQLVQGFVGVPAPPGPPGDVVEVVHPADVERDVDDALDECQVAPRVGDLGQLDDVTPVQRRGTHRPGRTHKASVLVLTRPGRGVS